MIDQGTDAWPIVDDAYPWLVNAPNNCGGALIASNVVLTAAHCVDLNRGAYANGFTGGVPFVGQSGLDVDAANTASPAVAAALNALRGSEPAIAYPTYGGGWSGSDVALIIFPEDVKVDRRVLKPARVAPPSSGVGPGAMLVSHVRHEILPGGGCWLAAWQATSLVYEDVQLEADQNGLPYFDLIAGDSETCDGDSGSPIIYDDAIISVISGHDGWGDNAGPDLRFVVRDWLATHGFNRDGDEFEAWEDLCDTDAHWPPNTPQIDLNGDGVSPPCDPCDDDDDPERLEDEDGDGLVNCLDPCPEDPKGTVIAAGCAGTERGEHGDSDCDGICDLVDACDAYSPHPAANVNLEAEEAWGAAIVPDACEPVLVPVGAVDTKNSTIEMINSADTTFVKMATWRQVDDWVTREHRTSRGLETPGEIAVPNVATHARFCQPSEDVPNCLADGVIDEGELRLHLTPATETANIPYHRITLGSQAPGEVFIRTYNGTIDSVQWDYEDDETFWGNEGIVDVPPETNPFAPGVTTSGLNGTMWFHAASVVGHPGLPANDIGTGVHPGPTDINNSAQLASHYFAIDPESIRHTEKYYPIDLSIPEFAWRDLPRWPDEYQDRFWGIDPFDHVMIFETTSQEFGYLTADGLIQPVTDLFSEGLHDALGAGHLWRRSEESWAAVALEGAPVAAALDVGGTKVAASAHLDPAGPGLIEHGDTALPPLPTGAQTSAATGFQAVYSRSMGKVFRIGGTVPGPAGPGAYAGVWRFDATSGEASPVWLPFVLGTVVASSFDAITRELVVLDLVVASPMAPPSLRLVRIDAFGRGARVVKEWLRDGPCTNLSLMVDGRGRAVVAGNLPALQRYALYTLEGEGAGFVSRRLSQTSGTLVSPPWSSETELLLPLRTGSLATGTVSLKDMSIPTGIAADVAGCF